MKTFEIVGGNLSRVFEFKGEYAFLSNFWGCTVIHEGINFPSSEHAYQAAKSFLPDEKLRISLLPTPGDAKRAGKRIVLRPDWEQVKISVMTEIVREKFTRNPHLGQYLIATGDAELFEGNSWHDFFWGVDIKNGKGENHLGKILMKVRTELKVANGTSDREQQQS
jgi:ribA/ribD-fused uncharacterized protein